MGYTLYNKGGEMFLQMNKVIAFFFRRISFAAVKCILCTSGLYRAFS